MMKTLNAKNVANDLDKLSLTRDGKRQFPASSRPRPAPGSGRRHLDRLPGIALPEWDYRKSVMLEHSSCSAHGRPRCRPGLIYLKHSPPPPKPCGQFAALDATKTLAQGPTGWCRTRRRCLRPQPRRPPLPGTRQNPVVIWPRPAANATLPVCC